jgi:hypothetical protein
MILNYYVHTTIFCLVYLSILIFLDDKVIKKGIISKEERWVSLVVAVIPFLNTFEASMYLIHSILFIFKQVVNIFKQNK